MKLPRLITRRRLKWVGMAACLLFASAMVASIWISLEGFKIQPRWSLSGAVSGTRIGGVLWLWDEGEFTEPQTRLKLVKRAPRVHLWFYWKTGRLQAPPSNIALPSYVEFSVPLWPLLLLIAVPTAWLWHTDRRAKPWQCAKCRYDLRGLDGGGKGKWGGVCPECGTPTERKG